MTIGEISTKISNLTTTDTVQYPNSDRLIDINLWQQKIVGMIMKTEDEAYFDDARFTGYPKVKIALTTNRDYSISPTQTDTGGISYSVLKLKSLSICYDGTNVYRATPVDLAETNLPETDAANTANNAKVDSYFSRVNPQYSWKSGALEIYPLASAQDVSNSGYILAEFERGAADFTLSDLTTGTAIPGFDVTFHAMLAYGPASEFLLSKGMPQYKGVAQELQVYEARLNDQYSSKQLDRRYQLQADYQSMK
jgi:hypothetical protein